MKTFSHPFLSAIMIAMLLLFTAACESPAEPEASGQDGTEAVAAEAQPEAAAEEAPSELVLKAQELAVLRKSIQAAPENADAILAAQEMSAADLEALLFEISQDPAASAAYAEASAR